MLSIAEGRTSWLDPTLGGLPADSALLPYWIGAAFIRAARRRGSTRPSPRAIPFALLLVLVAGAGLVRDLPPRAHRVGPAAAVRVRRRGHADRLRARDRRRRPAGPDRLARPAAARPRDDARAGAARQRRPLPAMRSPRCRSASCRLASRCCSRCRRWRRAARPSIADRRSASSPRIVLCAAVARRRRATGHGGSGSVRRQAALVAAVARRLGLAPRTLRVAHADR